MTSPSLLLLSEIKSFHTCASVCVPCLLAKRQEAPKSLERFPPNAESIHHGVLNIGQGVEGGAAAAW